MQPALLAPANRSALPHPVGRTDYERAVYRRYISAFVTKSWFHQQASAPAPLSELACPGKPLRPAAYVGHAGASVAIRLTFKWKMSFSKAVDVQWSAVHEQLASPGVSASVSVICELEIREKSVQNGGVEGLYFSSDCLAMTVEGLGRSADMLPVGFN